MITRREAFRLGGATVAALAGAGVVASPCMATPSPVAMSPELMRLIKEHREAYAAIDAFSGTVADAERAFCRDRSNEDTRRAKDEAYATQTVLHKAERAAFVSLLSYPVTTLAELRTIVAIGKATWWDHDDPEEEEADALIAGIMGGLTRDGNASS